MREHQNPERKPDLIATLAYLLFDPDTYVSASSHAGPKPGAGQPNQGNHNPATHAGRLPDLQKVLRLVNDEIALQPNSELTGKLLQTDDFGLSIAKVLQYLIEEDKNVGEHLAHTTQVYQTLNLLWQKTNDPQIWLDYLLPAIGRSTRNHGILCPETEATHQPNQAIQTNNGELSQPDPKLALLIQLSGNSTYRKTLRQYTSPVTTTPSSPTKKETPAI